MKLKREEILRAIKDPKWQELRKMMKGKSLSRKRQMLNEWLKRNNNSKKSQIQVTNYLNALKRGGIIK